MWLYWVLTGIIVFATFAMTVQQGIWNNLITLMAIVMGALVSFGVHQPIVVMLDEQTSGSYTYLFDFLVLWAVFALVTGLIKAVANALSKNRVNFHEKVDGPAGAGVGLIAAYALACFGMATFHTAPLSYDQMGERFAYGKKASEVEKQMAGASSLTRPDLAWLTLSQSFLSPPAFGRVVSTDGGPDMDGFYAAGFVHQHGLHRDKFAKMKETIVKRK